MHADQHQLFFSEGKGKGRTAKGMGATKEVITSESDVCNQCYMAHFNFVTRRKDLPSAKELLAAPSAERLPQGPALALATVIRQVYKSIADGSMCAVRIW